LGTTDDVASVVLFLCSSAASYLTGQAINVDGGKVMS
jgi:3-oxoacyl-[acyl-carrier protein] reductase